MPSSSHLLIPCLAPQEKRSGGAIWHSEKAGNSVLARTRIFRSPGKSGQYDMEQRVVTADPNALIAEISRLRGEVERLESRVEELDRLANMDTLVPVANRRGLTSQLDM